MKKIVIMLITTLFITSSSFSLTTDDLLKVSEIEGTKFSCLYYAMTTKLGELTASGEYKKLDIRKRLLKFKANRILNKKKYLSEKNSSLRKIYYQKFIKFKNAYLQTRDCKNYKTAKISCEIYTAQEPNVKVLYGQTCNDLTSIVAKIYLKFSDRSSFCTGTLIAPNAFLTAAHCVYDQDLKGISIKFMGNTYDATSWYANPNFNYNNDNFEKGDIGLVFINQKLSVQPFPLVDKAFSADEEEVGTMIGHGISDFQPYTMSFSGGFSTITGTTNTGIHVKYNSTFGSNTCSGDSGGPLAVYVDGTWKLFGVTSWGDDTYCGYYDGEDSWWSRINSEENIEFLETYLPNIFE